MASATAMRTNGRKGPDTGRKQATPAAARRRQLPLVIAGVLLVVGCALFFADLSLRSGHGVEMLMVAEPVPAGGVLSASDLRVVRVTSTGGLSGVPADQEQAVLGRPVAVPLVPGALLVRSEVGSATPVGAGSEVVAVGLKAGGFPPDLAPGDRVEVVPVASSQGALGGAATGVVGSPVAATVLGVAPASSTSGGPTVFSLVVGRADASQVANLAAAGEASLVQVGPGG